MTSSNKHRLVVLISGSGTNLQAIIDAVNAGAVNAEIGAVISNKESAKGLQRAAQSKIATAVVDHKQFDSKEAFDRALIELIDRYEADTVLLAGFMRILTPTFVSHYAGKVLNIHPSLLPKFQGLHTHQRALEAGEKQHGCSIHFVTDEVDGGPVIAQAPVSVEATDAADSLAKKVLRKEHILYPLVVSWKADGRLKLSNGGVWLDGEKLGPEGYQLEER